VRAKHAVPRHLRRRPRLSESIVPLTWNATAGARTKCLVRNLDLLVGQVHRLVGRVSRLVRLVGRLVLLASSTDLKTERLVQTNEALVPLD